MNEDCIRIENYGGSPVAVAIYGANNPSTRAVGSQQTYFVSMESKGSGEVGFYLEVEQLTPTQTKTTQRTIDGIDMASYILDNDNLSDFVVYDDEGKIDATATSRFRLWWLCAKGNYDKMMEYIRSDSGASAISDGSNSLNWPIPITEIEVAIAAGIHCMRK